VSFIASTIRRVREIVIVIADLYGDPEGPPHAERTAELPSEDAAPLQGSPGMPGLEFAARFGGTLRLEQGWRPWLARWLGRAGLASEAPASIAVAASAMGSGAAQPSGAWLATPVHLVASLTSLHLDRRGILRLPAGELEDLAADFRTVFGDSGFSLAGLPSGDFLLLGPTLPPLSTIEPARAIGRPLAHCLPSGEGATVLRRLQAEIEMWLHGHTVNQLRIRRGEPPVSALWPWGGGPLADRREPLAASSPGDVVFASDAYTRGLWHLHGGECRPVPDTLAEVLGYAPAQRAAIIVEVGQVLQANPRWTLLTSLAAIDARWVAPAAGALRNGHLGSFKVLANDRLLGVSSRDRRKWWRRRRSALEGLLQ
jgi:hypothetical protein